jgi:opacity protein-like surface antigen
MATVLATPALADGFYVTAYGGANWNDTNESGSGWTAGSDVGTVIGAAYGASVKSVPGLRVEADASYRTNNLSIALGSYQLAARDETWALMGNAVYDLPLDLGPVHPYVLAGAGVGKRDISLKALSLSALQLENTGIVWQVGAGVNTTVADGVQVGLGYRYLDAPDIGLGPFSNAGGNQSLVLQATFDMN